MGNAKISEIFLVSYLLWYIILRWPHHALVWISLAGSFSGVRWQRRRNVLASPHD